MNGFERLHHAARLVIAQALYQAGIDADVDLRRDEYRSAIQIRVFYGKDLRRWKSCYYMDESVLYGSRDPEEYLRSIARDIVEDVLRQMDRPLAKPPKSVLYASTPVAPPPTNPDAPRALDLTGPAIVQPTAQPKREIDV